MLYYFAETAANGSVNNPKLWRPVDDAASLKAAKRHATRRQVFQGTALHIGIRNESRDGGFVTLSVKRPDVIDMNKTGRWADID